MDISGIHIVYTVYVMYESEVKILLYIRELCHGGV